MPNVTRLVAVIAALGLAGCMSRNQQPQDQPGSSAATSGGAMAEHGPTYQPEEPGQGRYGQGQPQHEQGQQNQYGQAQPQHEQGQAQPNQYGQAQQGQRYGQAQQGQQYGQAQQGQQYGQAQQGQQYGQAQQGQPQGAGTSDREIRDRIQRALSANPNLRGDAIAVRVQNKRVQLAGLVDSENDIRIARDVATSVAGADNVDTQELRVR